MASLPMLARPSRFLTAMEKYLWTEYLLAIIYGMESTWEERFLLAIIGTSSPYQEMALSQKEKSLDMLLLKRNKFKV